MESVRNKAKELLSSDTVKMVIGYGEGSDNTTRALFIRKQEDVNQLIYDTRCVQNLALYLTKHEVKHFGKLAIVAPLPVMRAVLQLNAECQITEENVIVLGVSEDSQLVSFNNFQEIEAYIALADLNFSTADRESIEKLEAMTIQQRWDFWTNTLSKCIKCYACRSACPMCYCNRCQVECNQPQWVTTEATPMGNFEWHLMRAMHLVGRCVNCGECARACPMELPVNLLTYKTSQTSKSSFDAVAGTSASMDSVLSSYKTNDKENFIR